MSEQAGVHDALMKQLVSCAQRIAWEDQPARGNFVGKIDCRAGEARIWLGRAEDGALHLTLEAPGLRKVAFVSTWGSRVCKETIEMLFDAASAPLSQKYLEALQEPEN